MEQIDSTACFVKENGKSSGRWWCTNRHVPAKHRLTDCCCKMPDGDWDICKYALTCKDAVLVPGAMPVLYGYEAEEAKPLYRYSVHFEAVRVTYGDAALSSRVRTMCGRMGIKSLTKLMEMDDDWFDSLIRVQGIGEKVAGTIFMVAGKEFPWSI